jgi:hypothetical protein
MLTATFALCVALVTACLPILVRYAHRLYPRITSNYTGWLPTGFAALCMAMSVFLPDIHISNQTHTFQQHFVGGGMYAASLFIYTKQLLGWRLRWLSELLILFAWVSAFGVAVELVEFLATQIGIVRLANADTDWDLLANTLGAFVLYLMAKIVSKPID